MHHADCCVSRCTDAVTMLPRCGTMDEWELMQGAATHPSQGQEISPKVNKLTSIKTQLPYEYYSLPYCRPEKIQKHAENLGEVLRGDRIENSVYQVCTVVVVDVNSCVLRSLSFAWTSSARCCAAWSSTARKPRPFAPKSLTNTASTCTLERLKQKTPYTNFLQQDHGQPARCRCQDHRQRHRSPQGLGKGVSRRLCHGTTQLNHP